MRIDLVRRHPHANRGDEAGEGAVAVIHGLRGRRSNRTLPREHRERVPEVAGGTAVPGLRADTARRAPGEKLRGAGESGHATGLDVGGRPVEAAAQAGQAPPQGETFLFRFDKNYRSGRAASSPL